MKEHEADNSFSETKPERLGVKSENFERNTKKSCQMFYSKIWGSTKFLRPNEKNKAPFFSE